MKCPVCGRELDEKRKDWIGYTLCEYGYDCPCGYWYEFAYGADHWGYGPFDMTYDRRFDRFFCWLWRVITFEGCITESVEPCA